jgi:hypothetical protein
MIHSAPKMLHEKNWRAALLSEPAVGEANPIGFDELRGGRDVLICHASFFPFCARARAHSVICRERSSEKRCALPKARLF